jgi:hypothetical protein
VCSALHYVKLVTKKQAASPQILKKQVPNGIEKDISLLSDDKEHDCAFKE